MSSEPAKFFGKPGQGVPTVDPSEIKDAWDQFQEIKRRHEASGSSGLVAVCGGSEQLTASELENKRAVGYRCAFLQMMVQQGDEFSPWIKDGQPDDIFIRAIAEIPMEWMEVGVTRKGPPFDGEDFMRRLRSSSQGSEVI